MGCMTDKQLQELHENIESGLVMIVCTKDYKKLEALAELKKRPEPTEFTRAARQDFTYGRIKKLSDCIEDYVKALGIIDQQAAENSMLIEERLPNFCIGVECGCAGRVKEARIKLRQELEQILKGKNEHKDSQEKT